MDSITDKDENDCVTDVISKWLVLGTRKDHHPGGVANVPGPAQGSQAETAK